MGADQATPAPTATRLSAFRREMRSSKPFTASPFSMGLHLMPIEVPWGCHVATSVGFLRPPSTQAVVHAIPGRAGHRLATIAIRKIGRPTSPPWARIRPGRSHRAPRRAGPSFAFRNRCLASSNIRRRYATYDSLSCSAVELGGNVLSKCESGWSVRK